MRGGGPTLGRGDRRLRWIRAKTVGALLTAHDAQFNHRPEKQQGKQEVEQAFWPRSCRRFESKQALT